MRVAVEMRDDSWIRMRLDRRESRRMGLEQSESVETHVVGVSHARRWWNDERGR